MRSPYVSCRLWIASLAIALAATTTPLSAAEDGSVAAPWQDVITGQIQAFRDRDAPAAFDYAGTPFKVSFGNADMFFEAIVRSGYAPIMESASHSFGEYRLIGQLGVMQQVRFVGNDQQLYEAVYQLTEEGDGWRVQGVRLFTPEAMAV